MPVPDYSVFISHSSKDKELAIKIACTLEEQGLRVWIAPRDIGPGADYGAEIIRGINNSKCFMLLFSGAANMSTNVLREVERAASKSKPIYPIRIEDVPISRKLEFFVSMHQWVDAIDGELLDNLGKLVASIQGENENYSEASSRNGAKQVNEVSVSRAFVREGKEWLLNADDLGFTSEERTFLPYVNSPDPDRLDISHHLEIFKTYRVYRYDSEAIFAFPKSLIWFVLTRSEFWQYWMEYGGAGDRFTALPAEFDRGSHVKHVPQYEHDKQPHSATVIDAKNGESLKFVFHDYSNTFYVTVSIHQLNRTDCRVSVSREYYHRDNTSKAILFIASLFGGNRNKEPEGHRKAFQDMCEMSLRKLENLCSEYDRYGRFFWENSNSSPQYYETFHESGVLHIYPDKDGKKAVRTGSTLETDEIVGYVFDPTVHSSHEDAAKKCPVKIPRNCNVLDVLKHDGDPVRPFERILLLDFIYI